MEQLTIRMPKEHLAQIAQLADRMGLKKSVVARLAIKHFIEGQGVDDDETPFSKARTLIGVAESGLPDLGKNHRKYLINKIKAAR